MDVSRLRAIVFERSGISIDEHDPIIAVLIAGAAQTEEITKRFIRRSPILLLAFIGTALVCTAAGFAYGRYQANQQHEIERLQWMTAQKDPHIAALLTSKEGTAGLKLAELGVAELLLKCNGRSSWRLIGGYCVPMTAKRQPDGFKVNNLK